MAKFSSLVAARLLGLLLVLAVTCSTDGRPQVDVQFPFGSVNVQKGAGGTKVDVVHPAGRVNVNKDAETGTKQVDVVHPAGTVNVGGGSGASSKASVPQNNDLLAILRTLLGLGAGNTGGLQQRSSSAAYTSSTGTKDVDVNFPGGLVNVQKAVNNPGKKVDVVYPGGSVNVGGKGGNVDVAFPGGFVKIDPREPGKPRSGVVVFPFGSVRFG